MKGGGNNFPLLCSYVKLNYKLLLSDQSPKMPRKFEFFLHNDYSYVKLNYKIVFFYQSSKMPRNLVKIDFFDLLMLIETLQ